MPELRQSFNRTWVRRAVPAAAVAVLVIAGTVAVRTNATASPIDTYRTTVVTNGSVEQRLDLTCSVQRVNQASQSFAVSGTVSSVSVAVGDTVTAGQTVATLDPKPLNTAVTMAKAALAQAKATLESDQSAAAATTSTTASAGSTNGTNGTSTQNAAAQTSTPTTSPRVASPSGRSDTSANQSLAAAQQRVRRAQDHIRPRTSDVRIVTMCSVLPLRTPFFRAHRHAHRRFKHCRSHHYRSVSSPCHDETAGRSCDNYSHNYSYDGRDHSACLGALKSAPTQQQIQRDQRALITGQADLTKAFTALITSVSNTATAPTTSNRSGSATPTGSTTTIGSGSATSTATDRPIIDRPIRVCQPGSRAERRNGPVSGDRCRL